MSNNPLHDTVQHHPFPENMTYEAVPLQPTAYPEMSLTIGMRPFTPQPSSSFRHVNGPNPPLFQPSPRQCPPDLQSFGQQDGQPNPQYLGYNGQGPFISQNNVPAYTTSHPSGLQVEQNQSSVPREGWPYFENTVPNLQEMYQPFHEQSTYSPSPQPVPAPDIAPPALSGPRLTLAGSLDPTTGIFYRTPQHPRLRTAQACEKCRVRKAKCSGEHPSCRRCVSRGLICEYAAEGRMRGPNKPKNKDGIPIDGKPPRPSARKKISLGDGSKAPGGVVKSSSPKLEKTTESPLSTASPAQRRSSKPSTSTQHPPDKARLSPLHMDIDPAIIGPPPAAVFPATDTSRRISNHLHAGRTRAQTPSSLPIRRSFPMYPDLSPPYHRSSVHGMSEVSTITALQNARAADGRQFPNFEMGGPSSNGDNGTQTIHSLMRPYLPRSRTDSWASDASIPRSPFTMPLSLGSGDHSGSGGSSSPSPVLTPAFLGVRHDQDVDVLYHPDSSAQTSVGQVDGRAWNFPQELNHFDGRFGRSPLSVESMRNANPKNMTVQNGHVLENELYHSMDFE